MVHIEVPEMSKYYKSLKDNVIEPFPKCQKAKVIQADLNSTTKKSIWQRKMIDTTHLHNNNMDVIEEITRNFEGKEGVLLFIGGKAYQQNTKTDKNTLIVKKSEFLEQVKKNQAQLNDEKLKKKGLHYFSKFQQESFKQGFLKENNLKGDKFEQINNKSLIDTGIRFYSKEKHRQYFESMNTNRQTFKSIMDKLIKPEYEKKC